MNKWKLDVNIIGDTNNNIVMLNGDILPVSKARLGLCADNTPYITLDIPIDGVSNTLELSTNTNEDIDQHIEAVSVKDDEEGNNNE